MILSPEGLIRYARASSLADLLANHDVMIWGPGNKPLDLLAVVLTGNGTVRVDGVSMPGPPLFGGRRRRRQGLRTSFTIPAGDPVPVVLQPKS